MRPAQEKDPTYGGANDVIQQTCPRCHRSTDTHRIQRIVSGEDSEGLLTRFQRTLDEVSKKSLQYDNLRESYLKYAKRQGGTVYATSMMGTAVATIGTQQKMYATLSGPGPSIILPWITRNLLPKDLVIVDVDTALTRGKLYDIGGNQFTPVSTPQGRGKDYGIGNCAAPKVLNQIFMDAKNAGRRVEKIELSEMFWRDFAADEYNREWRTGSIVPSCDTCKQVLPQMLCTNTDD